MTKYPLNLGYYKSVSKPFGIAYSGFP